MFSELVKVAVVLTAPYVMITVALAICGDGDPPECLGPLSPEARAVWRLGRAILWPLLVLIGLGAVLLMHSRGACELIRAYMNRRRVPTARTVRR